MGGLDHFLTPLEKRAMWKLFLVVYFFTSPRISCVFRKPPTSASFPTLFKIPLLWPTLLKCDENNLWLIYHLTSTSEVVTTVHSRIFHAHAFRETSRLTNSCSRRTFRSWIWSFCKIHVQTYWKPLYIYLQKYFKYCNELFTTRVQRTPWPARTTNDDGCEFDARLI